MRPTSSSRARVGAAGVIVVLFAVATSVLVATGKELSIDDHFRVFHAMSFVERPAFALSAMWLPGYSWALGGVLAVVGETWWTPRLVGFGFALATLAVTARARPFRDEGAVAAALVAASPVFVLVAPTPLSESMFLFACVASARSLARFRMRGDVLDALLAALFASFASAVRLEGWLLLPVVASFLLTRASAGAGLAARWAIAGWLGVFPLLWLDYVAERDGNAFVFLNAVRTDLYGRGDLLGALQGPPLVAAVFAGASLVGVVIAVRLDRRPSMRVHQAFSLVLFGASLLAIGSDNVPSQLPIRLLLPGSVLAAVPVASLVARTVVPGLILVLGLVGMGAGFATFAALPDRTPAGARTIGAHLAWELEHDPAAHALLDGAFPDITAVAVASSGIGRVHVEGSRRACPIRLLTCDSPCSTRPAFADSVRLAVIEREASRRVAVTAGFVMIARAGRYGLYRRPRSARPLCAP